MRIVMATLALIVLLAPAAGATLVEANYDETFAVSEGARLVLEQTDGEVDVEVWDRDEIQVQVDFRMEIKRLGWGKNPTFEVEFDQRGDTVHVLERRGGSVTVGIFHQSEKHVYQYLVRMPAYAELELVAEDGDARIDGLRSSLDVKLDDGSLWVIDCELARAQIEVEDGDVHVTGGEGNYDVKCDDGDVVFRQASVTKLDVRMEDGDVDLELTPLGVIDWEVQSDDGGIDLDVTDAPDAEVELYTDDGRCRVRGPGTPEARGREDRLEWTSGDGKGRILLESDGGDVRLSVGAGRS